jgi:ankyrin repeat protein
MLLLLKCHIDISYFHIIKYLIEHGADINIVDEYGENISTYAKSIYYKDEFGKSVIMYESSNEVISYITDILNQLKTI